MEIKRYTVMDILKTTTNGTEIYYSRADLIAAGVLVPVPDGEACRITGISMFSLFTCDHDGVWLKFGLDSRHYYARNIITGEETALLDSATIQPVRLARLEDVG